MKKIIFALFLLSLASVACTKHKDDVVDTAPQATIQFASPTQGASFTSGDSILIKGTAVSTATIHGYDLIVRRTADTTKLYFLHVHDHNATLQIAQRWKADVSNASLQAEVVLYLDHDGHTASKRVGFSVK